MTDTQLPPSTTRPRSPGTDRSRSLGDLRRRLVSAWARIVDVVDTDILVRESARPLPAPKAHAQVQIRKLDAETGDSWQSLPDERRAVARRFRKRGDTGYLALVDGRFGGWIWLSRTSHRDPWSGLRIRLASDEAYACALWVLPEVRPLGVGAMLLTAILTEVRDDPALERVCTWVDKRNRESQILLRLMGFVQVQRVKRVRLLRFGLQLRGTDKPAFGPVSTSGRHQSR